MFIQDDGIRLFADLKKPENSTGKVPLVIIIHGLTGHMEEAHLVGVADTLCDAGYAVLRVDMYGHGKSEGKFRDHTLYKWVTNALTVIDYARNLADVSDIYLCGHSQGGLTAVLAGAMKHDVIKGMILLSPACMIPDGARKGDLLGMRFDPDHLPEEVNVWDKDFIGSNYFRVAQMIRVEESIDRYTGPVLVVQGELDDPDLMKSSKAAAERYKNCEYVFIRGDTHCYDNHPDQMLDAVKGWISRNG